MSNRGQAVSSLLTVNGLDKWFGGLHAVNSVDFQVTTGAIMAVIGPNGAGKTTLFNMIAGFLPSDDGSVGFMGEEITGRKPHQVARLGILRTFQNLKLCGHMSVVDNVLLGRHTTDRAGFLNGMFRLPSGRREERTAREEVMNLLSELGIADLAESETAGLAFGKQRAVELARALAADPKLLLLDEPAAGLNMRETEDLAELIVRIRDGGRTILLVEHDMSLVMDISDRVAVLNFGSKIAEGTPSEVQRDEEVIKIYLGGDDDA